MQSWWLRVAGLQVAEGWQLWAAELDRKRVLQRLAVLVCITGRLPLAHLHSSEQRVREHSGPGSTKTQHGNNQPNCISQQGAQNPLQHTMLSERHTFGESSQPGTKLAIWPDMGLLGGVTNISAAPWDGCLLEVSRVQGACRHASKSQTSPFRSQ